MATKFPRNQYHTPSEAKITFWLMVLVIVLLFVGPIALDLVMGDLHNVALFH